MHKENACMFEWHSAVGAVSLKSGGRDGASGGRRLRLSEVRGWHLAQLAVFADQRGGIRRTRPRLLRRSICPWNCIEA